MGRPLPSILRSERIITSAVKAADALELTDGRGEDVLIRIAAGQADGEASDAPTHQRPDHQHSAVIAHNLFRELEMYRVGVQRFTTAKRAMLWIFAEAATIRQRLILRAGRLIRPRGRLCLTMSGNEVMRRDFLDYLEPLKRAS